MTDDDARDEVEAHDEGVEVTEPETPAPGEDEDEVHTIDLVADELALARAQVDSGQPALAEGTLRRRLARLEAAGVSVDDETDALRALLAEALWRQGRLAAARATLDAIRPSSPQRRLPIVLIVEAEALASAGERDRAVGGMERVVTAVGVDAAWELRAGVPGRLSWPLATGLRPEPARAPRPPWTTAPREAHDEAGPIDDERVAAARARMEEARVAYVAGELERGDAEMSIAVRLDSALAGDGVAILEPMLGGQPPAERLLLYGDLLRAAGREVEASDAFDRAAGQRS